MVAILDEKVREDIKQGIEKVLGNCYFCGKKVNGWSYCFGCKEFICEDCDETGASGVHHVKAHKEGVE